MIPLGGATVMFYSRKHTELYKQKDPSRTNVSFNLTKCKTQNFPRMTRFTINVVGLKLQNRIHKKP